jgi:hypothetical protein
MSISLSEILDLVGSLDDSTGQDASRERFRRFLRKNTHEVGEIRDYVEQCLRTSGEQYNRALQDLINYLGEFLSFKVTFGRYRGVQNQVGFDGHWESPTGLHIVVEVRTTEAYTVKTNILIGYIDELISNKRITSWDAAMGLYVVGRPDPELRQLENAIVAEKRTYQLRVISAESLLSLAEIMSENDVRHEDILSILRPSGPSIDPLADLIAKLVAQQTADRPETAAAVVSPSSMTTTKETPATPGATLPLYWLTPVKDHENETAEECVQKLVGKHSIYAFGERTPGRTHIKPGDWICFFYATGTGIVAHANVASAPEKTRDQRLEHPDDYPYVFHIQNQHLYIENPVVLNPSLRQQLDAFKGRDPDRPWAWFVQATRKVSPQDFHLLTQRVTT